MSPIKIALTTPDTVSVEWTDQHRQVVSLKTLRDHCPCAGCQGETVLLKTYTPPPQPDLPGKYSLKSAQPVGSYALQLIWGDGHSTGLYTWSHLRSLCECEECRKGKP